MYLQLYLNFVLSHPSISSPFGIYNSFLFLHSFFTLSIHYFVWFRGFVVIIPLLRRLISLHLVSLSVFQTVFHSIVAFLVLYYLCSSSSHLFLLLFLFIFSSSIQLLLRFLLVLIPSLPLPAPFPRLFSPSSSSNSFTDRSFLSYDFSCLLFCIFLS